jgi:hypothetical protein
MIEDLIGALVRSRFGDVKRRTTGAILELAALGMTGLATGFLFIALYLWLSVRLDAWLAALITGGSALLTALVLMFIGRTLMRRKERRQRDQAVSGLEALGLLAKPQSDGTAAKTAEQEPGAAMVGAALAAGILLGRTFRR